MGKNLSNYNHRCHIIMYVYVCIWFIHICSKFNLFMVILWHKHEYMYELQLIRYIAQASKSSLPLYVLIRLTQSQTDTMVLTDWHGNTSMNSWQWLEFNGMTCYCLMLTGVRGLISRVRIIRVRVSKYSFYRQSLNFQGTRELYIYSVNHLIYQWYGSPVVVTIIWSNMVCLKFEPSCVRRSFFSIWLLFRFIYQVVRFCSSPSFFFIPFNSQYEYCIDIEKVVRACVCSIDRSFVREWVHSFIQ